MKRIPTLLLADDERILLDVLGFELDSAGFDVIKAENGKQAYNICLREHIDFIVSDISMPEVNGFTLLKKLRLVGKEDVPVIFITAFSSHYDEFADLKNVKVFSKPFEAKLLIQKIKEVLQDIEDEKKSSEHTIKNQ